MRKKQTREGPAFFEPCGEISDDGTHERIRTSAAPSSLRALIKNEGRRFEVQNAKTVPAGWQGRLLAPCRGFEPPAYRLGVPMFQQYRLLCDTIIPLKLHDFCRFDCFLLLPFAALYCLLFCSKISWRLAEQ